jgi:hypothetical protein
MRNLPSDGEDGSAFADFLSRVKSYPPPPGFWTALLYAAGGAVALLIAGLLASALPTTQGLRGDIAVGASEVGSVLELFRAPGTMFYFAALLGFAAVVAIAARRRLGPTAAGVLTALPMLGLVALTWVAVGWVLVVLAFLITILLWLFIFALMAMAGFRMLLGDLGGGFVILVIAFAFATVLETATSEPSATGSPGRTQPAGSSSSSATSPEAEPDAPPYPALTQRRIDLEARITAESAGWKKVPFVPPYCGDPERRMELDSLRRQFAAMKRQLRFAEQYNKRGVFRTATRDLNRVSQERHHAMANPQAVYERYERCPSGVGAMTYLW